MREDDLLLITGLFLTSGKVTMTTGKIKAFIRCTLLGQVCMNRTQVEGHTRARAGACQALGREGEGSRVGTGRSGAVTRPQRS